MFGWSKNLKKGMWPNPATGKAEYDWKLKETWEDYPVPDYNAVHTYCQVEIEELGKVLYYRTRNPHLKVGDIVRVPFGYNYGEKIGTILSIKNYRGNKAPFPLEKTRHIIDKV